VQRVGPGWTGAENRTPTAKIHAIVFRNKLHASISYTEIGMTLRYVVKYVAPYSNMYS
jgi:hypothetical protein